MPTLSFTLTMPNRGSWNGRWSGENNLYAIVRSISNSIKGKQKCAELSGKGFYYRWSDGWGANVSVREVSSAESRKIKRASRGFCGYDWMVDSILQHGDIYASHETIPKKEVEVSA